ncbi:MAG: hypothetical protein IPO58_19735 [Betaproteobacteria bacterium]|nr:hypothetical protein [Betaproteobacteria bacterium]
MNTSRSSTLALAAAFALSLSCNVTRAASGDADPSFGTGSYVRYAAPKTVPGLFGAALGQDDGSVIVAGGAETDVFVRHYRPDGTLDMAFGTGGTTFVPGLRGAGRVAPNLHLYRDPNGGVLVEQAGKIRRLNANGVYDSNYSPDELNVYGRGETYTVLPQNDGRFVVVAGQVAPISPLAISVRFYLPDGKPDTVRGDATGERVLYPGGTGTSAESPTAATMDAEGKILIAARWGSTQQNIGLALIRLNADGGYDNGFGQNGVVVIGTELGNVTSPQISVGPDGRIAYYFGSVSYDPAVAQYFVIYVLLPDGRQDASAPAGGRISVAAPQAGHLDLGTLRWASGSPDLMLVGAAASPVGVMIWRANLGTGVIGVPEYSAAALGSDYTATGYAPAGNGILWGFGTEDNYIYGRIGVASLSGSGRGVLLPFDTRAFAVTTPARIVTTFSGRYTEAFSKAKLLADGGLLVLGSYNPERQQYAAGTLTRFTAEGQLDTGYGSGTGRIAFGTGDGSSNLLVPSTSDTVTVLKTLSSCGFTSCFYRASLLRFTAAGVADATFGTGGTSAVAGNEFLGTTIAAGFVDAQGAVTLLRLSDSIRPFRVNATGNVDQTFLGATQAIAAPTSFSTQVKLDALPDGRLQAVVVSSVSQQMVFDVYRWLANGQTDPASLPHAQIAIATVDGNSDPNSLDTLPLGDGRTLIVIDQASQRIVLRLSANGSLDNTFGNGGSVRIDGNLGFYGPHAAKLALQPDGKILLSYNVPHGSGPLGTGFAVAVARFSVDGQRDPGFTADGRFDSLFSLSDNESASDLLALPDGRLLVAGQSEGYGLLLRLRGTWVEPAVDTAPVVEFYNTTLGHYFITSGQGEISAIEAGAAGPGWQRTGYGFRVYIPESGIPPTAVPACRFYGTPGRGPNSHFYTPNASECAGVKLDPGWSYEGIAFHVYAAANGQCAAGRQPIYRVYNNRFAQNDSNHRYTTDSTVYAQMQAQGWLPEGVVMCAPI